MSAKSVNTAATEFYIGARHEEGLYHQGTRSRRIAFRYPQLPSTVERVSLRNLTVGDGSVDRHKKNMRRARGKARRGA